MSDIDIAIYLESYMGSLRALNYLFGNAKYSSDFHYTDFCQKIDFPKLKDFDDEINGTITAFNKQSAHITKDGSLYIGKPIDIMSSFMYIKSKISMFLNELNPKDKDVVSFKKRIEEQNKINLPKIFKID